MRASSGTSIGITEGRMVSLSTPRIAPEWRDNCVSFSLSGLSRQKSRQNGAIPDLRHPESAIRDKNPDRLSGLQFQVSQGWHCRAFGGYCPQVKEISRQGSRHFGGIRNRDSGGRSDHAWYSALLSGFRCPRTPDRATRTGSRTLCPDSSEADRT
jgi:hypothetical protein